MKGIKITILFTIVFNIGMSAQKSNSHKKCIYCIDGEHQNESPYTMNFKSELPIAITGIGTYGVGQLLKKVNQKDDFTIEELNKLDRNNVNSFDRGAINNTSKSAAKTSDLTEQISLVLPLLFLTNQQTRKEILPLIIMTTEVYTIVNGLAVSTKFSFNRIRPQAYNENLPTEKRIGKSTRGSFLSGHTSVSTAFSIFTAKVITDYHPNMKKGIKIGLWSVALTLPAATGYYRIKGGKHFNSDILASYAVGALVGWFVPHLHKKKKNRNLSIQPFNYNGATGLTLNWKL